MEHELLEMPARTEEKPGAVMMAAGPLNMAMQAMKHGMSIADMRAMLELQKEWEANEARKAYALAMSAFKAEPMTIYKSKEVGFKNTKNQWVGYKHAELSDVTSVICPAMSKHQLSHRWDVAQSDDGNLITVTCRITHALGHSESIQMTACPDASGQKNQLQQTASAVTYLQRYTLLAITGMATTGQDDDGRGGKDADGPYYRPEDLEAGTVNFHRVEERDQRPPTPPAAEFYPQERFENGLATWTQKIQAGAQTADRLIQFLNSKQPLTEGQKATLRAIKTNTQE